MNCCVCRICGYTIFLFCCDKERMIQGCCAQCVSAAEAARLPCGTCHQDITHYFKLVNTLMRPHQPQQTHQQSLPPPRQLPSLPEQNYGQHRQFAASINQPQQPLLAPKTKPNGNRNPSQNSPWVLFCQKLPENQEGFGEDFLGAERLLDLPMDNQPYLQKERRKNGLSSARPPPSHDREDSEFSYSFKLPWEREGAWPSREDED